MLSLMARFIIFFFLLCSAGSMVFSQRVVSVITINGSINPASADYIHDALAEASVNGHVAVILELNTPGGLLQSTRNIVSDILTSPIPVIVFVHPRGGQAASAGAFIAMAGHIAAMAPGTNIGAAHPVTVGEGENVADSTNIGMTKATNDAAAFARTIAEKRGRNVDWAESAVRQSSSITETEALALNVIDLIAPNLDSLLELLHEREIETVNGIVMLDTEDVEILRIAMSFKGKILDILSDPNIAYIFMMLGIYGLFFELYNPGSIFPGVVGGICIILAFYSFNTLPVNYAGIALILFGIILFLLEIKVVSHGLLSIGGVISLLLGSLMLFKTPTGIDFMEVSLPVILAVTGMTAAFFLFVVGKGIAIMRKKPTTGIEGIIGEVGVVTDRLAPHGKVLVHGEYWNAVCENEELPEGTHVVVEAVHNLKLKVSRYSSQ